MFKWLKIIGNENFLVIYEMKYRIRINFRRVVFFFNYIFWEFEDIWMVFWNFCYGGVGFVEFRIIFLEKVF